MAKPINVPAPPDAAAQAEKVVSSDFSLTSDRSAAVTPAEATRSSVENGSFYHSIEEGGCPPLERSDPQSLCGAMLGHFLLLDVLGSGGMGTVYRALDTSLQRHVAVKVISATRASHAVTSLTAAMVREAISQARLNHPNVVTIYYVGRNVDEPFLAMELVGGQTLRQRMQRGPIDYPEAIEIVTQLIAALRHAAKSNIVHGDIKPNNLLIDEANHVKLSDFGLARSTLESDKQLPLAGTPAYMAPEMLQDAAVSVQSDMYAIGVTLFEMVFGRLPSGSRGSGGLRDQLAACVAGEVKYPEAWPRHLPLELRGFLDRLLAKDPAARFADYDECLRELNRIQPVSTTVAGIPLRAAAFAVDQVALMAGLLPFAIPIYISTLEGRPYEVYAVAIRPWVIPLAIAALCVPVAFFMLGRWGWRTPGRWLFQLRVTEQHGLLLPRRQMMLRGLLRNATAWLLPLGWLGGIYYPLIDNVTYVVVLVLLLTEVLVAFVSTDRRSLHDWLFHSMVVLDWQPRQRVAFPRHGQPSRQASAATQPSFREAHHDADAPTLTQRSLPQRGRSEVSASDG